MMRPNSRPARGGSPTRLCDGEPAESARVVSPGGTWRSPAATSGWARSAAV